MRRTVIEWRCDLCAEECLFETNTEALKNGWSRRGDDDLCPACTTNLGPLKCENCGDEFERKLTGGTPKYCGPTCRNTASHRIAAARRRERASA